MEYYPKIKLRIPFEIADMGDTTVAVPVSEGAESFHGVIELGNDSARFMFERLIDGINLPDLISSCMKRYGDSTVEEVRPKVIAFIDKLKADGLLVTLPPEAPSGQ